MSTSKIKCEICGAETHVIAIHLKSDHPDTTPEAYKKKFPEAPLMSQVAIRRSEQIQAERKEAAKLATKSDAITTPSSKKPMHELFKLKPTLGKSRSGAAIMIDVLPDDEWKIQVPDFDDNYIFDPEMLKVMLMGIQLNIPVYLWGHAGTGKTSLIENICSATNRPVIRSQHTGSTEESHILGQMAAGDGKTFFEPGPLPMAMKYGWTYLADEYDFAFPQVLAVYQSVLEGKPLVIKEAPADSEWRIVKPHPNFRFFATGNTNGAGDESGLYTGTNVQNAANYERFGIVEQMPYMKKPQEVNIVAAQGGVSKEDAERLVSFAEKIRDAFSAKKISATIGPRVLINAAKVGVARASFMKGLENAFLNRLTIRDKEVAAQTAQRILSGDFK